ncbi:MAG: ABC transporter permease, partial [Chloroflexi bacterium]|nr:ABC transporter permease [Chloroflexota bacterium]
FRDPRTLIIIIVQPALQLLMFGYAITTTVDHIPTVVLDQASDRASREFLQGLVNSSYFSIVGTANDALELRHAIDAGEARAGVVIPPDFSRNLLAGRPAQVQVMIDGSDPNYAQTAVFAAGAVGQQRSAEALGGRLQRVGISTVTSGTGLIDLRPVVLYNPSMASITFMVPGLIGMILQFQTLILTAFAIVRERERGTLEQLIVTPLKPWELMLGKIVPYVLIAFVNVVVALGVGSFWFGVEYVGSMTLLLALSGLFLFSSLGIGMFISTISNTQGEAVQAAMLVTLPSFLLSGFVFPRDAMPGPIHDFGYLIPLTYFLQILRGIMLKGIGMADLWPQVLPLAIFGVAIFVLSALRFRKQVG